MLVAVILIADSMDTSPRVRRRRTFRKIMMDDFGSGYSSLNVLKDMEVDYLKIDMKFLQNKEFNGKGEKVLTSVIRMAKWLHLPSIVEGVETVEQVDFLKCIGCEYAQGYYYAKPLRIEEYEAFLIREEEMGAKCSANELLYSVCYACIYGS